MVLPMSRLQRNLQSLGIRFLEDTVRILTLVADRCNATPCPCGRSLPLPSDGMTL